MQVNLVVHAGSADDPAGEFGLASLTAAMLDEGAGTRSALEIADAVEFLGANLSTSSSFDASAVRLNVPARQLEQALPHHGRRGAAADVSGGRTRAPAPGAADGAAAGARRRAPLSSGLRLRASCSAPTHRYGTGATGTTATLKAFTPAQLRAFHAAMYRPGNATLIVAGDVTAAARDAAARAGVRRVDARRRPSAQTPRADRAAADGRRRSPSWTCRRPSSRRSASAGSACRARRPTTSPLQVLNTILGGSFTSRLNQNLREEHGYSYGASSRFDMRLSAGPFFGGRRRADRQDRRVAAGILQRARPALVRRLATRNWRRPRTTWRWAFPGSSRRSAIWRPGSKSWRSTSCPTRYYADYIANIQRRHGGGRAEGRGHLHPTRQVRGGRRGRPAEDRAGHPRAEPGPVTRALRGRGGAMSVSLTLSELLDYSDHERAKWRGVGRRGPEAAEHRVPGGRPLSHAVEPRRARLPGGAPPPGAPRRSTPPESTGVVVGRLGGALRVRGPGARRFPSLRRRPRRGRGATKPFTFTIPSGTVTMSRRKLAAHILLHEIRHWAQVAHAARIAGLTPPGEHDLFFFPGMA